jgi:hypothetical protein
MDFQSMFANGMDFNKLVGNLNSINPQEILSKFGYNNEETSTILKGDMSPILKRNEQDEVLDYETIIKFYGNIFNDNLISYFFKKAKEKSGFTEDEIKTYLEAYNSWFDFIFNIGRDFIYQVDEELKDSSILIKLKNDVFQMSKIDNINAIIYIEDFQLSGNK